MSIYFSKNFKYGEIMCPCGCKTNRTIDPELIYLSQALRDKINEPIFIPVGGGIRCIKYNNRISGYIDSPHIPYFINIKGKKEFRGCKAFDMFTENMDMILLAREAKEVGFKRIGLYPFTFNRAIHADIIEPYPNESWVRDKSGKYKYFKTLEEAIKCVGKY